MQLSAHKKLIGKEKYSADLAAVFYDVDLKLVHKNDTISFGQATFNHEDWKKNLEIIEINDWELILIRGNNYFQVLGLNQKTEQSIDTTFSPLELPQDNLWNHEHLEIPAYTYGGYSKIDSIVENNFYITYGYRIGLYEPFRLYDQTILYTLNENIGKFETIQIFERTEKR